MNNERFLVTGANGFLGLEMVKLLISRNIPVRALVRTEKNGEELKALGAEIAIGDLRDQASLERATEGISGVYHIGAIFRQANEPDGVFFEINVEGTRKILEASIKNGVKRLIHCSTGGVLGDVQNPPGSDKTPYNPGDVYQRSKMEGEKLAVEYFKSGRIGGVVIRPGMIYGPGDTRNFKLFKMIANGKFFYVGPGQTLVHFVDVRDVAHAFLLAMEHTNISGEIYHVPGERAVPLKTVVKIICQRLGVSEPWLHLPVKPMQWAGSLCEFICKPFGINPPLYRRRVDFFTKTRHFDGSKAAKELGYKPAKKLEDEVVEITDWYKTQGWI